MSPWTTDIHAIGSHGLPFLLPTHATTEDITFFGGF
jgi:hypothetical protein